MALQQHFLDEAQANWKPTIQPNRIGDNLARKAVAFVAHGRLGHLPAYTPASTQAELT